MVAATLWALALAFTYVGISYAPEGQYGEDIARVRHRVGQGGEYFGSRPYLAQSRRHSSRRASKGASWQVALSSLALIARPDGLPRTQHTLGSRGALPWNEGLARDPRA